MISDRGNNMPVLIKQPKMYFNYAAEEWYEPYDHTLVYCECGNLCEKGIGTCDDCIDKITNEMSADLDRIFNED